MQIVLVALVEVWPKTFSPWVLAVASLAAGVIWISAFLVLLPMYHHHMNQLQVALAVRCGKPGSA